MKKALLLLVLWFGMQKIFGQVKIGNNPNTINPRSLLELESTDKALLLPRLNNTQMSILGTAAADGMLIYNTDNKALYIFRNSQFVRLADTTRTIGFPYTAIVNSAADGFNLSNNGTGRGIVGYANSDNGITGNSNLGNGGAFSSSSGYALVTLSGDVGIGTGSPAYPLDVNGRMRLRNSGSTSGIWYNKAANTEASFAGQYNDTIFGLYGVGTGGNWKFLYDLNNTRMGIGTAAPQYPLTFSSALGDKISFYGGSATSATNHYGMGIQGSQLQLFTPGVTDDIVFGIGRSNLFNEKVRFTGNGKVGIGTNNPSGALHVKRGTATDETARFEGTVNSSHFNYSTLEDTYIRGGKANSRVIINDITTGEVTIANGGGNVGIGINGAGAKLHVATNIPAALILNNTTALNAGINTELYFKTGTYYTGKIRTRGTAADGSAMGFYTNATTTADNLAERLTILDQGFVGINNTNPSYPLDVTGNIRMQDGNQAAGKVMTSDATGRGSWQVLQTSPSANTGFQAVLTAITSCPAGTTTILPYSTAPAGYGNFDDGNNFSSFNNRYIAPATGLYHFDGIVNLNGGNAGFTGGIMFSIIVNGINNASTSAQFVAGQVLLGTINLSWNLKLNAGDYVQFGISHNVAGSIQVAKYSPASGYRVY
ncbi:MAG: hypothetical protein JWQ09_4813 [Segetibacter sp.]|nr:hypothetical protein [Segetibacter sp.]